MKKYLILVAVFGLSAISADVPAQDRSRSTDDLYGACASTANNSPLDAEKPCNEFLAIADPRNDKDRIRCARTWLTEIHENGPYLLFLHSLQPDPKAQWFVYSPDSKIDIADTSETDGPFEIQITRTFADSRESALIKTAEAVYLAPGEMMKRGLTPSHLCKQDAEMRSAPIWGGCGNDNIEMTEIVTASAVRYYYDLSLLSRKNPRLPSGFTAMESKMNYKAEIKYFDDYSHAGDSYHGVYVADMTLKWGFSCGILCGVGFARNKVVVLDAHGNVLAMYLDSPVNLETTVS
ncbi:MAG TPA: hypothetical protein VFO34_12400 [Candidatus Acidoferrales bacterium]|nr:hypothetical protein [Candidatus Acidoferrales bacterium]